MKHYRDQNYYECLEISPDASPLEIRRAYKKIFDLYQDESIASYSFFSEKERKEILSRLEEAYLALINPEFRAEYDRNLIEHGLLEEEKRYRDTMKDPIPIYDFKKVHLDTIKPAKRQEELKRQASENPVIQNILAQDTITGADLKKMRMEMEIPLEEISEATNIRIDMLLTLEEDNRKLFLPVVYIKGFLKSYARYLQVDENIVIQGFLKCIEGEM